MNRELIERLWKAANTHCCVMAGEYLDPDFETEEGDELYPPCPTDDEALNAVIEYLEGSE